MSKLKGAFRGDDDDDEDDDAMPPSAFENAVVDKPMKKGKGSRGDDDDATTSASSGTVRFAVPEPGDRKQKTPRHVRVAMPQAEGGAKAKITGGKRSKAVVAPQAVRRRCTERVCAYVDVVNKIIQFYIKHSFQTKLWHYVELVIWPSVVWDSLLFVG